MSNRRNNTHSLEWKISPFYYKVWSSMVKRTCRRAESEGTLLPAAAVWGVPHSAWPPQAAETVTTQTEAVPGDSASYCYLLYST